MEKGKREVTGSQNISFRVSGDEMTHDRGYQLDYVLSSLENVQDLITKTYLALNERQRFTESDGEKLIVRLKEVQEGSLWTLLQVDYNSLIVPATAFIAANPDFVLSTIKDSYSFLKAKFKAEKEGKAVHVEQKAEAGSMAIHDSFNGDNQTINIVIPAGMDKVAEQLQPQFSKMTENIDGKKVKSISIGDSLSSSGSDEPIKFDINDKEVFSGKTFLSEDEFQILGKITSGNFETNRGRIEIVQSDSDELIIGRVYTAVIDEELHAEEVWKQMFLTKRPYYCKCRYNKASNGQLKLKEVIITDWDNERWEVA